MAGATIPGERWGPTGPRKTNVLVVRYAKLQAAGVTLHACAHALAERSVFIHSRVYQRLWLWWMWVGGGAGLFVICVLYLTSVSGRVGCPWSVSRVSRTRCKAVTQVAKLPRELSRAN